MLRFFIAVLLLTSFSLSISNAQNIRNAEYRDIFDPSTRPVILNEKGIKIETSISLEQTSVRTNGDKFYYWYEANKIMMTQGGYSGTLLHGTYKAFYRSNQLKEAGAFRLGVKHDKWTEWDENGYIKKIVQWSRGYRHGETIEYSGNGVIKKVTVYNRGDLVDVESLNKREKKKLYKSFAYDIGDNDY